MQKFQDLLTQAAQLKQQQLKQQRKNFEALPEYLKSGLNYAKKYVQLRKQHYLVQKYISQKLKKQGNDQYQLQNYAEALGKYQQALSVFRYIHATKYENLKDEDIIYENYNPDPEYKEQHETHLVALYLNICSALTKMNKKDEALHSSQEALKINQSNAKIYYKKAQAFLQYINRQSADIKLGFYYLNKAYELSKDQSILTQMHKIKKELDQERQKEKKWFKFMFDKNKQANTNNQVANSESKQSNKPVQKNLQISNKKQISQSTITADKDKSNSKIDQTQKKSPQLEANVKNFVDEVKASQTLLTDQQITVQKMNSQQLRNNKFKEQFDRFKQQNQNILYKNIPQQQKLQRTKVSLKPYLIIPRDDRWLIKYQENFIHKHGSKIYSTLQLYNYSDYLIEFKSLLAKCLELKQATITPHRDENKLLQEKIYMYNKFVQWIKNHPVEKYKKYIERYDLQTQWIKDNRGRTLDQIYANNSVLQKKKNSQSQNSKAKVQEFIGSLRHSNNQNDSMNDNKPLKNKAKAKQNHLIEQMLQKQEEIKRTSEKNKRGSQKTKDKKGTETYGFKEQWQCEEGQSIRRQHLSQENDQVPKDLKGFLQNYEEFPTHHLKFKQEQSNQPNVKSQKSKHYNADSTADQNTQIIKENPFGFLKTFIVILSLTLLFKIFF